MNVELIQDDARVEVDLAPGEYTLGGAADDAIRFEGLPERLVRLKVDERRLCFQSEEPLTVNGVLVPSDVWRMLVEGETLELGNGCLLTYSEDTVTERPAAQTGMVLRELLQSGVPDARWIPSLVCLTGLDMGRVFPLTAGEKVIGRGGEAELRIRDRTASRRHARLNLVDDSYFIEDLGSPNGLYINGKPSTGNTRLEHGDILELGRTLLRVQFPKASPPERSPAPLANDAPEEGSGEVARQPGKPDDELPGKADAARPGSPSQEAPGPEATVAGPGEWAIIGVGLGLSVMGALMGLGMVP